MYTEKTHQESPSITIQTKPGGGRVYMEDNRPEAVRQAKFINTIQLKKKQLYPIIQRTKITKSSSQSSSESSSGDIIDLEKNDDVNSLLSDLMQEGKWESNMMGEALRAKIANRFGHPDVNWDELFQNYLTEKDRNSMTACWKEWFNESAPWIARREEKEEKEEKKESDKETKSTSSKKDETLPYKGTRIKPTKREGQKGEFVGDPAAIHIHIVGNNTHLKLSGKGRPIHMHNNKIADYKQALSVLLKSNKGRVAGFNECLCWLCSELNLDVDAVKDGKISLK